MAETNPILKSLGVDEEEILDEVELPSAKELKEVEDALSKQTKNIAESVQKLELGARQTTSAMTVISSALTSAAEAQEIITRTKLNADLEAQNTTIDALEVAGGSESQVQLIEELAVDSARVSDIADKKLDIADDKITHIPFIDAIINDFRSTQVDFILKAAEKKRASTERELQNIATSTESVARTEALTKKTLNEGVIEANLEVTRSATEAKLAEQKIKGIQSNAEIVTKIYSMNQAGISNVIQIFRLNAEVETKKLAVERNKIAREEITLRREKMEFELPQAKANLEAAQLRLKEATSPTAVAARESVLVSKLKAFNDLIATEKAVVEGVQRGQAAAGTRIEDEATILFGMRQTGAIGAKYDRFLDIGSSAAPVIGDTPFDAKESLLIVAPSGNFKETTGTKILDAVTLLQEAKYAIPTSKGAPRDVPTLRGDFNQTAREYLAAQFAEIKTGDMSNPFHAPPMITLTGMKSVQESTLFKKVLEPLNLKEVNPQTIMDLTAEAIRKEVITAEQGAEGVETLFEAAAAHNSSIEGGYGRFGIAEQTSYNVLLKRDPTVFEVLTGVPSAVGTRLLIPVEAVGSLFGGRGVEASILEANKRLLESRSYPVDLMDFTQVQAAIAITMSTLVPEPVVKSGEEKGE